MTVLGVFAPTEEGASSAPSLWIRSPISARAACARRPAALRLRLARRIRREPFAVLGVRGRRAISCSYRLYLVKTTMNSSNGQHRLRDRDSPHQSLRAPLMAARE